MYREIRTTISLIISDIQQVTDRQRELIVVFRAGIRVGDLANLTRVSDITDVYFMYASVRAKRTQKQKIICKTHILAARPAKGPDMINVVRIRGNVIN